MMLKVRPASPGAGALALLLAAACTSSNPTPVTGFDLAIGSEREARDLLEARVLVCAACELRATDAHGGAIEVTSTAEFSDAFVHFGRLASVDSVVDLTQARYLLFDLLVPEGANLGTMKFNVRDARGNFGGVPEAANGFFGSENRWLRIAADLDSLRPHFKNWQGDGNPLAEATAISFNAYTTDQDAGSRYYVRRLALVDEVPEGYAPHLVPRPGRVANLPYRIDFDDEAWLDRQAAYRTFEASFQAYREDVAGNPTRAIRLKGDEGNRHIAFLPEIEAMTGHPLDLGSAERIRFRYYLVPDGDPVDGAALHVVQEGWHEHLMDTLAIEGFEAGEWREAVMELDELDLVQVGGEKTPEEILAAVHSLRLDLNYRGGQKDVEMWVDDFVIE